ncbi:hypothetical protein OH76DRAFT_1476586 [Lentinus brumalis]|uniref:Uncharacterized protein n=1 Tax=Lentinus brumalis TaxID=2498619 RepID=A0A371DXA3_9APHY|nr:hypothetical protein OH76DRAFT_1476586 [Polyporus brumalis]
MTDSLPLYRKTKTLFPRPGFFGVLTLQGEKMLAEAVPGIASDAEEMQAVRAIGTVRCLALCAQLGAVFTPFDSSALYRCFLVATTPPPADSHIASVPIDTDSGGNFVVACTPDPPIPVEGCNLWDNGDVSVRIQRRNNMFDHSEASYIHPTVASKVAGTYSGGQSSSDSVQSDGALEWGLIADTLGWTGQNTAKRYPLAEFSLDIPPTGQYAYCSPSEYQDAVGRIRR